MTLGSFIPANTNQVKNLLSTAVINGCDVTTSNVVVAVSADITISSGVIRFVDNFTNPELPNFKGDKKFAGTTLIGVDISIGVAVLIDSDLVATAPPFTGFISVEDRRDIVELAGVNFNGTVILTYSQIGFDITAQLKDLSEAVGFIRMSGLKLEPNGVNKSFNRTAGVEYSPLYENYPGNKKNMSFPIRNAVPLVPFFDVWQDSSEPSGFNALVNQTVIRTAVFDDGDAGGSGPDGVVVNNSAQIFRVYEVGGTFSVLFGQTVYISMSAAIDAISTETFNTPPFFAGFSFRGFIIARGGAVDFSDPADALMFPPESNFITVRQD